MGNEFKIAIQVSSLGTRCGIATYSERLEKYLNDIKGIEAKQFANKTRNSPDVISIQYEPGLMQPNKLQQLIQKYPQPIVITAHHMGHLQQFYPLIDGIVIHSKNQIESMEEPWNYKVLPHPALVFPKKDKKKLREKWDLPQDKKILGTMGFIAGTGKGLPNIIKDLLMNLNDDEFLYFATSFWKGGDFGFEKQILDEVKRQGKEKQFRIDSDFVSEEDLNEKMQLCDLLFAWNRMDSPGSNSGIAMDMIGSRTKLIVKDSSHYGFVSSIEGVETGRQDMKEFVEDTYKVLREGDLKKVPKPEPYSWQNLVLQYRDYFLEISGE